MADAELATPTCSDDHPEFYNLPLCHLVHESPTLQISTMRIEMFAVWSYNLPFSKFMLIAHSYITLCRQDDIFSAEPP